MNRGDIVTFGENQLAAVLRQIPHFDWYVLHPLVENATLRPYPTLHRSQIALQIEQKRQVRCGNIPLLVRTFHLHSPSGLHTDMTRLCMPHGDWVWYLTAEVYPWRSDGSFDEAAFWRHYAKFEGVMWSAFTTDPTIDGLYATYERLTYRIKDMQT